MTKLTVLGSSSIFPFPRTQSNLFEDYLDIEHYQKNFPLHDDSLCNEAKKGEKNRRTRSCLAIQHNGYLILLDSGPDILYQLRRAKLPKPDAIFITHNHPDANYGVKYLANALLYSESAKTMRAGHPVNLFGIKILPFRVHHARNTPTVGFLVRFPNGKKIIYATDMSSLGGLKKYFQQANMALVDGSILKRSFGGHLAIISQLKTYKKWRIKSVLFTHIGHSTLPYKELRVFVKNKYKNTDVAYDGMTIK
ncbi:MAG: MBL fold metallo-hydrolase [Candidatus Magasanikbacteria bacterium]|nr:MBL fold metallo-hydrolase [Candidatus Magasanikbacteria bacterium]